MFKQLRDDVQAVFDRDPAARNTLEVLLTYPGIHALILHRVAHQLWQHDLKGGARVLATFSRFLTGVEIHPAAKIGHRLFIDQIAEHAADRYGHQRIAQVHLSEKFYMEQMPKFKAHLEDATLTDLPRDEQCRDDLRAIKKVNGIPKLPKAKTQTADGKKLQRHGDFAISLFLADFAMHQECEPAAGVTVDPGADQFTPQSRTNPHRQPLMTRPHGGSLFGRRPH